MRDPGQGQSGRDSVHFMYHNDNSAGYVRMAEGTRATRHYRDSIYCVLLPRVALYFPLVLSKNGVVLIYDGVPSEYIKIEDQLPTIASDVLRPGRGHTLSSTVTGGTWPDDITYERVVQEKDVGFEPGHEIPDSIRTMAWSFMGQATPTNYGKLVFGLPLSTRNDFDPSSESVHGLLSGSSHQREEPEGDDEPMSNPYTRPSRFETRGGSQQREEPEQDTSAPNGRITGHLQEVQNNENMLMPQMNHISKLKLKFKNSQQHSGLKKGTIQMIHTMRQPQVLHLQQTLGSCMKLVLFAQEKKLAL